jgi:arginyl-tRNA synthetase
MQNPFITEIVAQITAITPLDAGKIAGAITSPPNESMGDYAFPCFMLSKELRKKPNEIAEDLSGQIAPNKMIKEIRPVGPYLNFFVQPGPFVEHVLKSVRAEKAAFGNSDMGAGKTVVVEYSSPNIAKHLGIHHVRTTMIGNALDKIHRALGYDVVGINFLGDWGTQFGILIAAYKKWGGPEVFDGDPVANLNALYVRFNQEAEENPDLKDEGRSWFKKLEDGDAEAVDLWNKFRGVSLAAFEKVYARLGVHFDVISGESMFEEHMPAAIERLEQKGLAIIDDGALIVKLKEYKMPPVMLRKSDGATLYDTRDIAAAEARFDEYKFAKMVYVVGADQKLHFRQIFKTLELMGYEWAKDCIHVDFGIIRIKNEEGLSAKMSTRGGTVVMLKDVLGEAVIRVGKAIAEKNPDLANRDAVAEAVGVGAVVFNDLKRQRGKDVDFDWEQVLSFEGETGPYVQYAHVRLCSILRKHGLDVNDAIDFGLLTEPEDLSIAKALSNFGSVIERAARECEPCVIAQHLLDLCSRWSSYYHKHLVLTDDTALTAARILLVDALRQTILNGLTLLGLKAPEEM